MSPRFRSPIQTQTALGILKNPLSADHHGSSRLEGRQAAGKRQVFVQTETGCVLSLELDRRDNAHTVKRKLQLALNVPTDESLLTFGDMVLENDLSYIQNHSSLLLTKNSMHRSSSTPCLSPTGRDIQQKDKSGPIEVLGLSDSFDSMRFIVKDIVKAIENGVEPLPIHNGLGGAYYFRNIRGESIAIVKPTDEEPFAPNNPKGFVGRTMGQPGLKQAVRVGETGIREVAAYLLDYDHFANVPPTALVKVTHSIFNVNGGVMNRNGVKPPKKKLVSKIASLQQFIPHDFDASDHGTSSFPISAVHRIGILDIRIMNTDRHAGNLLVKKRDGVGRFGTVELIPIDHGLSLPESLEDPYFEWIHWPQASIPFSEEELEYIRNLDPAKDCEMLRNELPVIREACLRVLVLCTMFLKEGAEFGLCLSEIGEMMTRESRGGEEEPSELEALCLEARRMMVERAEELALKLESVEDDDILFHVECDDLEWGLSPKMNGHVDLKPRSPTSYFGMGSRNGRNPLSRLEEGVEDEEEVDENFDGGTGSTDHLLDYSKIPSSPLKLSNSLKNSSSLWDKNLKSIVMKSENGVGWGGITTSSRQRSANDQLLVGVSFVKLVDMSQEVWGLFLEKFQELLNPSFVLRKMVTSGQKLRLGTSCKF